MDNLIRISAAGHSRIIIDQKYLLCLNRSRLTRANKKVYTPFGGSLTFDNEAIPFLQSIGSQFEKDNDLRLMIPEKNIETFEDWFKKRIQREISVYRELEEELVQEEKILSDLKHHSLNIQYVTTRTENAISDKPGIEGTRTKRYAEIFDVQFSIIILRNLKENLRLPNTHLTLVTSEEIRQGNHNGIKIGGICKLLLD